MNYNVTLFSSDGKVHQQSFEDKSLVDAHLLDHLRGAMSFKNKAFAVVESNIVEYVTIEDNCTKWMSPIDFFDEKTSLNVEIQ